MSIEAVFFLSLTTARLLGILPFGTVVQKDVVSTQICGTPFGQLGWSLLLK